MQPDPKRSRFFYGVLFAWAPCLPLIVVLVRDIAPMKQMGLGAVAGGLTQYGLIVILPVSAIAAIVLLTRSFARGHWARALVSIISLMWSSLVLASIGLFFWAVSQQY